MAEADANGAGCVTVAKVGEIPEGEGASYQVGERLVAVFNHAGRYLAIDDLCPHMGASLGAGHLDEEGVVTCPWHAWRFNACTGKWADNPRLGVDTFDGGLGNDKLYGESGTDWLYGDAGADLLNGGSGADRSDNQNSDTRISIEILLEL